MQRWLIVLCLLLVTHAWAQGPKAAYAMNETSGTTTADLSGNNNTGTLINGPTRVVGKYSNGINFDGVNDFVTVPDSSTLDVGNVGAVEVWVKLGALNRWNAVIAKGNVNNDNAHNYALEVNNLNKWQCVIGTGSASRVLVSTASAVVNAWTHLACVWNGTNLQMYINGALHVSVAQSLVPVANAAPLLIGEFGGNADPLQGVIDEVRIYNRALTAAEVTSDMNTAIAAPPPPPSGPAIKISGATISGGAIGGAATQGNPPPPPPPTQHSVDLSWTASTSSNVTNYKIYRGTTSGGPYSLVSTVGAVTAFTDSTVANTTTYYYVVTAVSPDGESVFSNQSTAAVP